jgi:putative ATP-dependent endonuclease of the OLD family
MMSKKSRKKEQTMKLESVVLHNFRCYKEKIRISIDDLTALIGKNDIGKSSILEALEIFFNENIVKLEHLDSCVYGEDKKISIGCVFSDFPEDLVLDVRAKTNLHEEYLLNSDKALEIHKIYDCSGSKIKVATFALASHPSANDVSDLLTLKNAELKDRLRNLGIDGEGIDLRSNPSIRKAIWENRKTDLELQDTLVPLDKEDAKKIWDSLKKEMPTYALFQADRKSLDADSEIQDPMKLAIAEAIKTVEKELEGIKDIVREKATEVAKLTIEKLKEMAPELATELKPDFKAEPKWEKLFQLSLTGDDQIPINKRGSGVRRLILLNFFRAEAERKRSESNSSSVIYAIEEPEASQHPDNQKMIMEALTELSERDNCQVILTTHVPGLASLIPVGSLRYVKKTDDGKLQVQYGEDVCEKVAQDLGVLPDKRTKVLFCVEGPHDVRIMKHLSVILNRKNTTVPILSDDPRVAVIPLGGNTLVEWVQNRYLKNLGLSEIHVYDRGLDSPPKYERACNDVNARGDGSWATLTRKNEIENYFHPAVIKDVFEFSEDIEIRAEDDVPMMIAKMQHERSDSDKPWDELNDDKKDKKIKRVKQRLSNEAILRMTDQHIADVDSDNEIEGWFLKVQELL